MLLCHNSLKKKKTLNSCK
uniref:Uncharacterized protein n=1 Tax=Anguilla anguilla TaxID=7936 RepID=A0A0E9W3Q0_ANGAN